MGGDGGEDAHHRPGTVTADRTGITGATRLFPIIGAPVTHVFSPPAFNAWFEAQGVDCRMVALEVPPDGLDVFLDLARHSPSLIGCSVTYPHKQACFAGVDRRTDRAARLGALNTLRREVDGSLTGDATDGEALCRAIAAAGVAIEGRSARILGAGGGAGLAMADALCRAGIARLALQEIDTARRAGAEGLVRDHWSAVQPLPEDAAAEILVNATTLGKSPADPCPFDAGSLAAAQIVCDAVTTEGPTRLVTRATRLGRPVVTGADIGAGQLPAQLVFLGLLPGGAG